MNTSSFKTYVNDIEGRAIICAFLGLPEDCPECHRGQQYPTPFTVRAVSKNECVGLFQCSFSNCRTPFFGLYRFYENNSTYVLNSNYCPTYSKPVMGIPNIIDIISPSYRIIYEQSYKAENSGLNLIAGCGYRKALEFLIKDYAIRIIKGETPENKLTEKQKESIITIKKSQLGIVINDYIDMPKVKSMAERATWLGNDETHYERRLDIGDINTMKNIMQLAIYHIETEELTKKMISEIQPK